MSAPEAEETTDVSLPADMTIGRVVRGAVRDRLDKWGLPDDVAYRTMMVATELASNALLHAAPPYLLRLSAGLRGVRIAIQDSVALTPSLRQYDPLALTGRGLRLVADCSSNWGVSGREDGKEVWADVPFVVDEQPPPTMQTSGYPPAGGLGPGETVPPAHDGLRRVRFLGVPVDAYLALQEWNDAVIRECELIAALESTPADLPPRVLELAVRLSGRFTGEREGYRDIVAHARADGETIVELEGKWHAPTEAAMEAAQNFLTMMEELDSFCRADILLSEPPAPIVVQLRRWFVTEMRAQLLDQAKPVPFDKADHQGAV